MRLSNATLPDVTIPRPTYDRGADAGTTGIVHIGLGNFHRAHEAMFVDALLALGEADDWRICGVGLLPGDRAMREALAPQDYLYTLTEKHPGGETPARVIGSVADYLLAPEDPEAVVARMADPSVRIVSLTITEGGYNINRATGEFETDRPEIVADAAAIAAGNTAQITTVFAFITAALARRRAAGIPPFTVMSCDNMPGNGHVAGGTVIAFARLVDGELADWIAEEVAFPNSMVDRITPVTTDADRAAVTEADGYEDAWPVVCEPFIQWVLEDTFTLGRPTFERVGVQIVDDVEPFELMKLRMLNASHQAIAYPGRLLGYDYAHEAIGDERILALVRAYLADEAIPSLPVVPDTDLAGYGESLIGRFANPNIRDTLARLAAETSDRIPKFVLPVTETSIAAQRPVIASALIVAAWARYALGADEAGTPIDVVDPLAAEIAAAATAATSEATAFLALEQVFGSLGSNAAFVDAFTTAYRAIAERGMAAAIDELIG